MNTDFLIYLAESSICLALFSLAYRLIFSHLTHFQWNRVYLLISLLLSVVMPLLPIPVHVFGFLLSTPTESIPTNFTSINTGGQFFYSMRWHASSTVETSISYPTLGDILLGIYLMGFFYKAWGFLKNLFFVFRLISNSHCIKDDQYCLVYTQQDLPVFSFYHFIFLSPIHTKLSPEELSQVMRHERVHTQQRHTLDLLLFEMAGILFWFNPLIAYLKKSLREVHEYIADAIVSAHSDDHRPYARLLLKLTVQQNDLPLGNAFSGKQLKKRIFMLTQNPSTPMQKLKFTFALPLVAMMLVLCASLVPNLLLMCQQPQER